MYLRMFITLVVSLFTTRIVFEALGLSDLGIYNVVGGVLSLMGILNGTLTGASQRFISFDLGLNNPSKVKKTFSTFFSAHIILAIAIVIIAETAGLWFVNNKLVIPAEKMVAANWVYQTAVINMVMGIVKSPFSASIIAHEKMGIYAYFSIIDVSIKLLIVLCLLYIPDNRLIIYALLLLLASMIDFFITVIYSLKKLHECSLRLTPDRKTFKDIFSFSGWTLFGQSTIILNDQLVNIFINWFFGTIANGARDIAGRINGVVAQFVFQFQMALGPAITKDYASGNIHSTIKLVTIGCKMSFALMLLLCVPIIAETGLILKLWLGETPEYTVWFTRLILINTLADTMTGPVLKAIQASGKIRHMQMCVSSILIFITPLSYLVLRLGSQPYMVYIVNILISIIAFLVRVHIMSRLLEIYFMDFVKSTIAPCVITGIVIMLAILGFMQIGGGTELINYLTIPISIIISIPVISFVALNSNEREASLLMVKKLIKKN